MNSESSGKLKLGHPVLLGVLSVSLVVGIWFAVSRSSQRESLEGPDSSSPSLTAIPSSSQPKKKYVRVETLDEIDFNDAIERAIAAVGQGDRPAKEDLDLIVLIIEEYEPQAAISILVTMPVGLYPTLKETIIEVCGSYFRTNTRDSKPGNRNRSGEWREAIRILDKLPSKESADLMISEFEKLPEFEIIDHGIEGIEPLSRKNLPIGILAQSIVRNGSQDAMSTYHGLIESSTDQQRGLLLWGLSSSNRAEDVEFLLKMRGSDSPSERDIDIALNTIWRNMRLDRSPTGKSAAAAVQKKLSEAALLNPSLVDGS